MLGFVSGVLQVWMQGLNRCLFFQGVFYPSQYPGWVGTPPYTASAFATTEALFTPFMVVCS
jgi:hypothetical protein